MEIVARVAKATIIALVTFGAIWSLTGSVKIGFVAALIPFILGSLAMLSEFAYGFAAMSLIVAVVWQVLPPEWTAEARRISANVVSEVRKDTGR